MRRYKLVSTVNTSEKVGWKRKLETHCVRRVLNYVRNNNKLLLYMIVQNFKMANGINLSFRTIRRYLHKNRINIFVAVSKP